MLAARSRAAAGPTAPARGLFLHSVEYPPRGVACRPAFETCLKPVPASPATLKAVMPSASRTSAFARVTALAGKRPTHAAFAWLHGNPKKIMDWQMAVVGDPGASVRRTGARAMAVGALRRGGACRGPHRRNRQRARIPVSAPGMTPKAPGPSWSCPRISIPCFPAALRSIRPSRKGTAATGWRRPERATTERASRGCSRLRTR